MNPTNEFNTLTGAKLNPNESYINAQGKTITQGSVITPEALAPQPQINIQTPLPEAPSIEGDIAFFNQLQNKQSAQEQLLQADKSSANQGIENLLKNLGAEGQEQLTLEQQIVNPLQTQITDLTGQVGVDIADYQKASQQYEKLKSDLEVGVRGSGNADIQASMLFGQQGAIDRAKASELNVKASNISVKQAQILALQGKAELAQKQVDRAIDLKYKGLEQELNIKKFQLDSIKENLTAEEKKRATSLNLALDKEEKRIAEVKENEKAVQGVALKIAEFGGDPNIVKNAKTAMEAISLAGSKLQDPRAKLELQKLKLDIQKIEKENALIGQPTVKEKKEEAKALASKEGQNLVLQDKLDLIDTIKTSSGMSQRVGSNVLSRKPTGFFGGVGRVATVVGIPGLLADGVKESTGSGQRFAGAVHRLASQEFINNLIQAKSQGATFGALTDREGDALRAAATQLNDWEIKDSDGKGTGVWNIDEKSFLGEVDRIESLSRKAMGDTFSSDEEQVFDGVFGAGETTLQADPSVYFNR